MEWREATAEHDFLADLGYLGLTARLKRLSDALGVSIKALYRAKGMDLEPSWHLVLLFLKERPALLTEMAQCLRLSQPAMTQMIRRMASKGYVEITHDDADRRRRIIRLSPKARRQLPEFQRIWDAGQQTVQDILGEGADVFEHLEAIEEQLLEKSFELRALERLRESSSQESTA